MLTAVSILVDYDRSGGALQIKMATAPSAPNEAQLTTKRAKTLSSAAPASAAVATASTDDAGEIFTLRAENAQQREEIEVLRRELEELREAHRIEVDDLHAAQAASAAKEFVKIDRCLHRAHSVCVRGGVVGLEHILSVLKTVTLHNLCAISIWSSRLIQGRYGFTLLASSSIERGERHERA